MSAFGCQPAHVTRAADSNGRHLPPPLSSLPMCCVLMPLLTAGADMGDEVLLVVAEDAGDTVAAALYDLIEERTSHGLVTLWTSNASLDDLLQMLPRDCGGPIVRRLIDFSLIIKV